MATKITIPVEFKATSNSMKEILQQFENGMSQVDLSTNLGKKLKKTLDGLKEDFSSFEEIAISPTVDRAGLAKAERLFDGFVKKVRSSGTAVENANIFDFNLSKGELDTLSSYSEKIRELGKQLEKLKKTGSNRSAESYLTEIGQGHLLAQARNTGKSFKGQSTLGANAVAMEKEAAATRDQLVRLQANQQSLVADAVSLQENQKALQAQLKTATKQRDVSSAIIQKGNFLAKFQGLDYKTLHTKSGALRGQTAVLNEFMTAFETGSIGGRINAINQSGVESVLEYLGFDAKQISSLLTQQISQIRRAIAEQLSIQDGSDDVLSGEAYRRIQNVQHRSQQYLTQYATRERYQQYEQEKNAVTNLTEQVAEAQSKIADNTAEQEAINAEIAKHQQLVTSLTSVITSLQRFQQQLDQSEIDKLDEGLKEYTQELADTKSNIIANKGKNIVEAQAKIGPVQDIYTADAENNLRNLEIRTDEQREAEQFTANLKQSIKQWMSAQQVINLIKNGIRQAYQDIQGLDKAMTNIAVVTDMSVGDLWGKINEYMSIAQQYGVSTQGVYEVSQLYYQQGLGTADVMAATTETLKMARIAGMDYADAADAMTVAIRSFKMEMTDAAHVTDVYSKVAAVTASDSEELAIAMSKTASSAESVGCSFENTTAMLAVMIETTRESAQNLGSALKSIISRYGEMKVGATVDAEGEVLDYNKVDTALKSIGISIKDTQRQFRDFDDVIFELSSKWDTLDKNTQRYIATIMAGNRQQSRFIALVDNWERLDEVASAAEDSEDAGLLQYAKTLDSLETKINNIKTSFQEFYMSIFNGPLISKGLDFLNNILQGFNKLSKFTTVLNIGSIVSGLKLIGNILVNTFSSSFSQISAGWKQMLNEMSLSARTGGRQSSNNFKTGALDGSAIPTLSRKATLGISALSLVGTGLSLAGSAVANKNQEAGAVMSSLGSGIQIGTMVGMINPLAGVITGTLAAIISGIASWPSELEKAQQNLEKAKEAANEANIERAKKKEDARNLEATISNLEKLQKARYSSEEAEQAFIDASNAAFEQFPQLTATFDEAGNAIIDVINQSAEAEYLLVQARKQAAEATTIAAGAELKVAQEKLNVSNLELKSAEKAFVQRILPDTKPLDGQLFTAFKQYRDAPSIVDPSDIVEYQDAVYNRGGRWSDYKNELTPSAQLERDIVNARTMPELLEAYNRGQQQIANGEDVTGGMKMILEKTDEVMENLIEGTSAEGPWAERYKRISLENKQLQESVFAGQKAVGYAYTNQLLTNADPLNEAGWRNIADSSSFLQKWVYKQAELTDEDFFEGELTYDAISKVSQIFQTSLTNYQNFFANLGYQLDDFNNILTSSEQGKISKNSFIEQFKVLFGNDETQYTGAVKEYWESITGNFSDNITRLKNDLKNNRIYNWSSHIDDDSYQKMVDSLPIAYQSYVSDFADSIDARLTAKTLTPTQASDIVTDYLSIFNLLQNDALKLTSTQIVEAQRLISEAGANGSLFSITGIQTLISELQNINIDTSQLGLDNFHIYAANLVTEWASLEDKLISNLNTATEAIQKASSGMELDEALKIAQKAGIDWSEFTFIDGKWYTDKIGKIETYYKEEQNRLQEQLKNEQNKLLGTEDKPGLLTHDADYSEIKGMSLEQFKQAYPELNEELWQATQTYWDQEQYDQWKTENKQGTLTEYWTQYFASLGQNVTEATAKALAYYTKESEKAAKKAETIATLTESLETAGYNLDKITANQMIASQGLKGYSKEDMAELDLAFDWTEGINYTFDEKTGTYNLIQGKLTGISAATSNAIDTLIDSEANAALEAVNSLTQKILTGEATDADYREAFKDYGQVAIEDFTFIEKDLQTLLYSDATEKQKQDAETRLKSILKDAGVKDYDKWLANTKDTLSENNLRLIELAQKQLEGTLTASEKLEVGKLKVGNTLADLQKKLTGSAENTILTWADLIKEAVEALNWSEIEGAVQESYTKALEATAKQQSEKTVDLQDSLNNIGDAAGKYSISVLNALAKNITEETKETIDFQSDAFKEAFKWDATTGTYAIEDENKFNKWITSFGAETQKYLYEAFNPSENQKAFNDAVKKQNLSRTFGESFAQLYTNLGEATLEDFGSLYDSLHGENAFAESGAYKVYQQALAEGETEILTILLDSLKIQANEKGIDTSKIEALIADLQQQILDSILSNFSNALDGTLTHIEAQELQKKLGLNLSDYTTQTATGLQLSEMGAIMAGDKISELYGATSEVAQQLVDAYAGTDGILGSWGAIYDAMNDGTDALKEQEGILKSMQGIYATMAENADFNFMESSPLEDYTGGLDSFVSNAGSAIDVLKEISTTGKTSYTSFRQLFEYLRNADGTITLDGATHELDEFYTAMMKTLDFSTGQIDFEAFAASFSMTAEGMSESLGESLQATAEEQADYWDGVAEMLEGYEKISTAMEGEGLNLGLNIESDISSVEDLQTHFNGVEQKLKDTAKLSKDFNIGLYSYFENWLQSSKKISVADLFDTEKGYDKVAITQEFNQVFASAWKKAQETFSYDDWMNFAMGDTSKFANLMVPSEAMDEAAKKAAAAAAKKREEIFDSLQVSTDGVGEITYEIKIESEAAKAELEKFAQTYGFHFSSSGASAPAIPLPTHKTNGIDASNSELEEFQAEANQAIEDTSDKAIIQVNANVQPALDAVSAAIALISEKSATFNVYGKYAGMIGGATAAIGPLYNPDSGAVALNGNVSGLALAEGNAFNRLNAGAHLANKTLIGELGPELAVYNGMYHLLGKNGAEFVDLPNDAIVFNHRQTEGIIRGQMGIRGKAMADGNVEGPAYAGGLSGAAQAARDIANMWRGIAANNSLKDLLGGGGGGGGGGNELKAVTAELQEWYNLTRQIAYLEQEINNLVAERENITDGSDYLKNLRETQKLLEQQKATQALLLDYQTQQLKRQADFINQHSIWGKYLTIDESGLLQYIDGNETNGGKGALEILQSFNEMSGQEQQAYLKKVGYSFTDQDGKALKGSDLAQKFIDQLQEQIDQYDALYDTVHETEETIEGINTSIEEINDEIKQNQMDLEEAIYDIIVDAWEAEIEQMQEQAYLIKEANDAYVKGLQDALNMEKELYSENQSIEERESLQRQLSLLRRSGGSASEIASLEEQLDSALKDEYFRNQEEMISNIEEANENQNELLEQQIKLQEDALEYQKENGVIWTKVYEVMARSENEILDFMQGKYPDFFSQSLLQQEEMLTDWAMKIGIYTADQQYKNHEAFARKSIWDSGKVWESNTMAGLKAQFDNLSDEEKENLKSLYASTYANEMTHGSGDDAISRGKADQEIEKYLNEKRAKEEAASKIPTSSGNGSSGSSGEIWTFSYNGKTYTYEGKANAENKIKRLTSDYIKNNSGYSSSPKESDFENKERYVQEKQKYDGIVRAANEYAARAKSSLKRKSYSQGGLVDYTGTAVVHGSPSKPEAFLNAAQTAQISEALRITNGKESLLESLRSTADKLKTLIHNISTIDKSTNQDITIAPGAVVIQVEQLADTYDIEELSNDVFNRIVTISSKATNRGVNRR